jgi:hypothetical protein
MSCILQILKGQVKPRSNQAGALELVSCCRGWRLALAVPALQVLEAMWSVAFLEMLGTVSTECTMENVTLIFSRNIKADPD